MLDGSSIPSRPVCGAQRRIPAFDGAPVRVIEGGGVVQDANGIDGHHSAGVLAKVDHGLLLGEGSKSNGVPADP